MQSNWFEVEEPVKASAKPILRETSRDQNTAKLDKFFEMQTRPPFWVYASAPDQEGQYYELMEHKLKDDDSQHRFVRYSALLGMEAMNVESMLLIINKYTGEYRFMAAEGSSLAVL